ncbi:hypothetical protein [Acidicapsa ligni]|uniref:hypothetical protein n=1 Tax=Acidicapsa ligni TaxID=542300 RepID=UPI0021E00EB4|nr:hypothetical protein [Acidicapsa ligni]
MLRFIAPGGWTFLALLGAALAGLLTGCGGSAISAVKAGPIVIAGGSTTQISSLSVASSLQLSMMPVGDPLKAGVDWTVTCEGNPVTGSVTGGSCGTLSPAHTVDGGTAVYTAPSQIPIGTTVTIIATVTGNPGQSSNVSLTVTALPIGVSITTAVPGTLLPNTQLILGAQLSNDPFGGGMAWTATCGASACGTVSPAVVNNTISGYFYSTYTAPADVPTGGTVTITVTSLTDTSRSASVMLTIVNPPAPVPVTVSVYPASVSVVPAGSGRNASLFAVVGNDAANAGVDWSLSCGASSCGSITSHTASGVAATYTAPSVAPPGGMVTVTAKSTTNPAISASATASVITATPIVVTLSTAPPATLQAGLQTTLAAKVANDTNNLGVDWTATCGGVPCGSFNLSPAHTASTSPIVYTAPATVPADSTVVITATSSSTAPSNPAVAVATIVPVNPAISLTQGPPKSGSVVALTQTPLIATVANDVAPGGVSWSVQCGSTTPGGCGWILPVTTASGATAFYTAPPVMAMGTSVTIAATSIANPQSSVSSSPVAIVPATTVSVAFVPSLPAQVAINATVNLTAATVNDATNAGVDWYVCPNDCGFFTIKPAMPAIAATNTTPYVPAVAAVTATSASGWSNGLPIPYTAPSVPPASGPVAIIAASHADSSKAISGTVEITTSTNGPALSGVVYAGAQPVNGASVSLFAAGTSGYASAASQVATAVTDKNGNYTVPSTYACPSPASQMYLVAKGGSVGSFATNGSLVMMTALGNCANLGSSPIFINEVTSAASAYVTSPFAANDELTGNNSYLYIGTSSGNLAGLANAFSAVNNLVDISTGTARFVTPAGNATVPFAELNTLADTLNACTDSTGGVEGDGSSCGILFAATDTLESSPLYHAIGPNDTLQAIFNVAQKPNGGFGYYPPFGIVGLATSNSPFQPILSATDFSVTLANSWPLSLHYTGGGGLSPSSMVGSFAVDGSGNLWITDTNADSAIEWNSVGAAISPSTGFAAGGGPIAIDAAGNIWISGNNALTELTSLGSAAPGSPFGGVPGGGGDIAIDKSGDLWITNPAGVNEFNSLGVPVSPQAGFINDGVTQVAAVGIDSSNNVWLGTQVGSLDELTNPGGQFIVTSSEGMGGAIYPQMAPDPAGDIWFLTQHELCEATPFTGGQGAQLIPNCYNEELDPDEFDVLPFYNARGVALDGAGTLWVASQGGGQSPIGPSLLLFAPSEVASTTTLASPALTAGPLRVAVDGSGNVWVLLADNSVIEHVGAAVPAVTPVAAALKNGKLGAKP